MEWRRRIVVGISGASGAPYARRLLELLTTAPLAERVQLSVVLSSTAEQVWTHECGGQVRDLDRRSSTAATIRRRSPAAPRRRTRW
jgi:3-polyprenyl-4-hydroxybenzoate decarboxylase